jgi:hypothetical protein
VEGRAAASGKRRAVQPAAAGYFATCVLWLDVRDTLDCRLVLKRSLPDNSGCLTCACSSDPCMQCSEMRRDSTSLADGRAAGVAPGTTWVGQPSESSRS